MKDEIKAGIIIGASLVAVSLFIVLIGGGRFFEKYDSYYVRVMNAAGLEVGAQVRLGGVRIGRVLSISGPGGPGEPVVIKIGIKQGTSLYEGTRALITQIGFVGDIYLLLAIDKTTGGKIKVGGEIPAEESVGFAVLMARLDGLSVSLGGLINDIDKLFSRKNIDGIEQLVGNTNKAIVSTSAELKKVAGGLKQTTDKLELVLNEIEELVRDNKGEVSLLIRKAREDIDMAGNMIQAFEKTARTVDGAVDLQSQNLDVLLNKLNDTAELLREALQEIRHKPWSLIYRERGKE